MVATVGQLDYCLTACVPVHLLFSLVSSSLICLLQVYLLYFQVRGIVNTYEIEVDFQSTFFPGR